MDVTTLSAQALPEAGGSPSVRASHLAQSNDAAQFLLELFKLISAPVPAASTDEFLADEPAEAIESGAELPAGGNVLPPALPIAGITQLNSPVAIAAFTNTTPQGASGAVLPSVANLISAGVAPKGTPGTVSTRPDDAIHTAAAEALLEPSAGDFLELGTAAAIETPAFQQAVEEAIQQLVEHSPQPLIQASAPDSDQERTTLLPNLSISATNGTASLAGGERTPVLEMSVPLGEPDWDSGVAERVLWMVREQNQAATIRLNPPGLGPLNVTIQVQDDQATVQFHTAHAAVREALDVAVPRLREMLAEAGVSLAGVNVSGQGLAGQGGDFAGDASPTEPQSAHTKRAEGVDESAPPAAARLNAGLIDFYA